MLRCGLGSAVRPVAHAQCALLAVVAVVVVVAFALNRDLKVRVVIGPGADLPFLAIFHSSKAAMQSGHFSITRNNAKWHH